MGKPKCNLTEEERERILPQIRSWISQDEEDELRLHFRNYLFYWYDYGRRETYCSACGARDRGVTGAIRHGARVSCLVCGNEMEAKAVNRYQYDMKSLATWGKAAFLRTDGEGNLLIMTADVLRYFNHGNLRGEITLETRAKYYLAPGKVQMWVRKEVYDGDGKWKARALPAKTVGEGWPDGYGFGFIELNGSYLAVGTDALERSRFRYSGAEEYFERQDIVLGEERCRGLISYLAQYAVRPQLEMVTKLGLRKAAQELVEEGKTNRKLLDWKAKTPAGFLRMTKAEAKIFLGAGMDLDELRLWRGECPELPMREYADFRAEFRREREARLLLEAAEMAGHGFRKARKYAERFPANRREASLREWIDYLDMAHRLGYDLAEETVAMPRELHTRHDNALAESRYRISEAAEKLYRKRLEELREKYEFRTESLSVLVPETMTEIVAEGQTLHHCVGGYAERHGTGKTCILFVRKSRKPERSFLTLELNEKKLEIIQIHGYKNERYRHAVPPSIRYQDFLNSWLSWVEHGSRRDDRGRPVFPKGVQTA